MSFVTRGATKAAHPLRRPIPKSLRTRQARRPSSHDHHPSSSESSHHAQSGGTGNESFGKGFYVTLAAIPVLYLTYQLSASKDNVIERFYRDYQDNLAKKQARDVLHTTALEQAISDRAVLFSEKADHSRDLRYTEFFNQGSPFNVAAGEGTADLSKLHQYYVEQRRQLDTEREQKAAARAKQ